MGTIGKKKPLFVCSNTLLGFLTCFAAVAYIRKNYSAWTVTSTHNVAFVTFAFTSAAGDRWNANTSRLALQFMYSSLVKSQSTYPKLHVFSNERSVIPKLTTQGMTPNIIFHQRETHSFPKNEYSKAGDPWRGLSLAKMDAVEEVIKFDGVQAIWIDLDTLLFVDLSSVRLASQSWVVGYQTGGCGGTNKNCSYEHVSRGGFTLGNIEPRFDAYGDLWSLTVANIESIRKYKLARIRKGLKPPLYDLQGYFTFMLHDGLLDVQLIHDILPYNFGFFCSNFNFPNEKNLEISVKDDHLICPEREYVSMQSHVGSISFTAITFQNLFLKDSTEFTFIQDELARSWMKRWFYAH